MASRRLNQKDCDPAHCPIEVALEVIGGMWKVIVVRELLTGTKRYSELHRGLRHATHKMLAQQLRQLEADGILDRKVYPQVPPKVEYLADAARPRAGSAARFDVRVGPSRHDPHGAHVASRPGTA